MKEVEADTTGWRQLMQAMRRKTLVVCRDCHQKIHAGQYDGIKLTKFK
jgi:predicted metal-binding protein